MSRARFGSALGLALALLWLTAGAAAAADRPAGTGIRFLYLVRHGMYDRVEDADDRLANGLNPLGHEQAKLLAGRLATQPVKPDRIVASDFRRARETAEDIGRRLGMPVTLDSLLRECTPSGPSANADSAACEARLAAAWSRYAVSSPDADVRELLVCHGNVIRWFVCRALGADARLWRGMDIGNASITVIAIRPDGSPRLISFSDVGHLPAAKQTWAGRGPGWMPAAPRAR